MSDPESDDQLDANDPIRQLMNRTAARALVGRAGPGYRTATALQLREDHAAARDAVQTEIDLERDFDAVFIQRFQLFTTQTCATSKADYLRRPDRGRMLSPESRTRVQAECAIGCDLQIVIGDGLSATAVVTQVPGLLTRIHEHASAKKWSIGRSFLVRYCRVGVMNDVGELLRPNVVVLLIGERPGLATAESLSAYMAYRPVAGHTDAARNLISNIHAHGTTHEDAAQRIIALAERFRELQLSGVGVSEVLPNLVGLSGRDSIQA